MRIYINYKKLVIITSPKSIRFDFPIEVKKRLEHKIKFFISHNESLAAYLIKTRISNYCSKISMKTIFRNIKNSSLTLLMKAN